MLAILVKLVILSSMFYWIYIVSKSYVKFRKLSQHGLKSKGIISGFDKVEGENSDTYFPIVQFRTYLGLEIKGKPIEGYDEKKYHDLPNEVEVIYLDSEPEKFIIEGQKFNRIHLLIVPFLIFMGYDIFTSLAEQNPDWMNEIMQYFKNLSF
ncbi:DUF3592 domain-containing protein [Emticicia fontis]